MGAPLSEDSIRRLVGDFYSRVRADRLLGPIFEARIGDAWDPHLARMCDFWSKVLLGTDRFQGNPMAKHVALAGEVTGADFERWLTLFRATADEVLTPEASMRASAAAASIAAALQARLFGLARPDAVLQYRTL